MKKLILSFCVCVLGLSLWAFEFSLGGYVGGVIRTQTASIKKALPQFGIACAFDFKNFGFQTSFGFDFWTQKAIVLGETKERKDVNTTETILICPYYPFHHEKFSFTIGPVIGFKFSQGNLKTIDTKESWFFVVIGGEFETRYAATDHVKVFLNLGLFTDTGNMQLKNEQAGILQPLKNFVWRSEYIYFVPKFGVYYTF